MMVVGKMIIIIIKITRGREGAFNNYVDQMLPNFDPTPSSGKNWTYYILSAFCHMTHCTVGFPLTQHTPLLVHVVIE